MNILVTGARGFIGKNLVSALQNSKNQALYKGEESFVGEIYEYTKESSLEELDEFTKKCDFVYHLGGVNRPLDNNSFERINYGLTKLVVEKLVENRNRCPIVFSSSIQAKINNPYGLSKKRCEDFLVQYGNENNVKVLIYRFSNLFGKWCKPNYNSVVATFCNNIARDLPIVVSNPKKEIILSYIDDVIGELFDALKGKEHYHSDGFCYVPLSYTVTLEKIVALLHNFRESRKTQFVPDIGSGFSKKLYSTYLSYLEERNFSYPLNMHVDNRGSFTEFLKTPQSGQVSINVSKPGVVKGNHWHQSKNEKFLVVKGKALIQLRKKNDEKVIAYEVSDEKFEVIDIPPGYTHNIINLSEVEDLVTIMWVNEIFDSTNPDTFALIV